MDLNFKRKITSLLTFILLLTAFLFSVTTGIKAQSKPYINSHAKIELVFNDNSKNTVIDQNALIKLDEKSNEFSVSIPLFPDLKQTEEYGFTPEEKSAMLNFSVKSSRAQSETACSIYTEMVDYNHKKFRLISNTSNGETSSATIFHYKQNENILTAEYSGGEIKKGHLIGLVDENGEIEMRYHHLNIKNEMKTGRCHSRPEFLSDGRIRLHENWQWTTGDESAGSSIIEEI